MIDFHQIRILFFFLVSVPALAFCRGFSSLFYFSVQSFSFWWLFEFRSCGYILWAVLFHSINTLFQFSLEPILINTNSNNHQWESHWRRTQNHIFECGRTWIESISTCWCSNSLPIHNWARFVFDKKKFTLFMFVRCTWNIFSHYLSVPHETFCFCLILINFVLLR
jgi:hypothetical protein